MFGYKEMGSFKNDLFSFSYVRRGFFFEFDALLSIIYKL